MIPAPADILRARASELAQQDLDTLHRGTDMGMLALLAVQWLAAVVLALLTSPLTWSGPFSSVHPHVWGALVLGGLFTTLPAFLVLRLPGAAVTRHCIAAAQVLYSTLFIHLGSGRIEWHFHVFCSLAFLAVYRDWRVLLTATTIVAIDHLVRGAFWPETIFGVGAAAWWRGLEHAGWVAVEVAVLTASIVRAVREVRASAHARASLEVAKAGVEREVADRTAQLDAALVEARSASTAKTSFLANMSHEIRTPMTAILGFTELLERPDLSESDRRAAMDTIKASGSHLLAIINNILDVSKIEAGRLDLVREPLDPLALVRQVAATFGQRAQGAGIELSVDADDDVPGLIEADPTRLAQILNNLVGNAVKFTSQGSVRIRLAATPIAGEDPEQRRRLAVDVVDTGIGIAPPHLAQLFQPFSQVDASGTRRFGGTGLGLAISRRLAELMGGTLTVASQAGLGSRFTVEVPVRVLESAGSSATVSADSARGPRAANPDAARSPVHARPPHGGRVTGRILLAEDGPDNQRLFAFHLKRAGAAVDLVDDGQQAVERALAAEARGERYDLILMDMQMPVLDGYGATRLLRERGYRGPIVALTAHAMTGDREHCLQAGCDDYESKPITAQRLIEVAARHAGALTRQAA